MIKNVPKKKFRFTKADKVQNKRLSDYGERFRTKQKCKRTYGLREKVFENYFKKAQKAKGNTADLFLTLIEKRLDNTVYASGLFSTRAAARQFVSHAHVYVNGKRVNISSYEVKIGDVITLKLSEKLEKQLAESLKKNQMERINAEHVFYDESKKELKVLSLPSLEKIKQEIDLKLIVEFYSK